MENQAGGLIPNYGSKFKLLHLNEIFDIRTMEISLGVMAGQSLKELSIKSFLSNAAQPQPLD